MMIASRTIPTRPTMKITRRLRVRRMISPWRVLGAKLALLLTKLTHPAVSFKRSGRRPGHRASGEFPAGCPGECRSAPLVSVPDLVSGREHPAADRAPASPAEWADARAQDWDRLA